MSHRKDHRMRCIIISTPREAERLLRDVGVSSHGIDAMVPKMESVNVILEGIECKIANILKQEMLAIGGDVAVSRGSVSCSIDRTDALIMGTWKQVGVLAEKLRTQPFGLERIGGRLKEILSHVKRERFTLKTPERTIEVGDRTLVMGILNVTPDSFSDGGKYMNREDALAQAVRMAEEGADMIDIGGESTRPGADPVPEEEEMDRVLPLIRELKKRITLPISIDTTKASVAQAAVDSGAEIINDVSAMRFDEDMAGVAARSGTLVVLMHMRGNPKTMQAGDLSYASLMGDITEFLEERIQKALTEGISRENIIVDPGIGFGKSGDDNFTLIRHLGELKFLGCPILVGPSRKSFVGLVTGGEASERIEGTAAAVVASIMNGARIIRVHDVGFMKKVAQTADAITGK